MDELSDTLLNQLYRVNCPIKYEEENDRYIIDVRAVANCNGGLRFQCPLCLYRKGTESGFKARGQPFTNSTALYHNHGLGYGSRASHCSTQAKKYYNLADKNFEFNLVKDISYVSCPFKQ
tara:strand:- start:615 stop:974 length:360 start_codon:yes stop_codon:yes gene_type:complete